MIIQMSIKNDMGDFFSEKMEVSKEQYLELIDISKKFYSDDNGFEMWVDDGFMVFPPDIVKKSILCINVLEYDEE